jgi:serine phosphatase RsbU (regulator of sigma subunit)
MDLGQLLEAVEAAPPVSAADVAGAVLGEMFGAVEVSFLIADYSGDSLIRLGHTSGAGATRRQGRETAVRVGLAGTPHGRALAGQTTEVVAGEDGTEVYAPVTSRGEAVGILELYLDATPDELTLAEIGRAAHALAYVIIANRRYTDLFEWGQRSVPLSLAAEIQHRLLPGSYTCEAGQFTLAAWLEPAGEVGGDTFDFSLDRDVLWFSMTDAMGHNVSAALMATVLVGSLRNGRRAGMSLAEMVTAADAALIEHVGDLRYVTGQIGRVDLRTGTAEIVNAGHPFPLRLRDGVVDEVRLEIDPPFGTTPGHRYQPQTLPLQPGDRLVFLTDGVIERRAAEVDVRAVLAAGRDQHPREAVQHLIQGAVRASGGHLEDDATAMCFDWHGGPQRERDTLDGANVSED